MSVRWIAQLATADEPSFRVGRDGPYVVAEWIGLARLRVRRDPEGEGPRLVWEAAPDADPRRLAKVRGGLGRALVRQVDGGLALHASAVVVGGRAIAFVGPSGAGKSTLAAAVCAFEGGTLLADDMACLERPSGESGEGGERFFVEATERQHALDEASLAALGEAPRHDLPLDDGKWLVPSRSPVEAASSTALGAIVHLAFDSADAAAAAAADAADAAADAAAAARHERARHAASGAGPEGAAPRLVRVRGMAAMALLAPQVPRLLVDEPRLLRAELDGLRALCGSVPLFELSRPRDLAALRTAAALVAAACAEVDPPKEIP